MHLYIHIPFCKQACHYCDFHFSTKMGTKRELVQAVVRELELQKDYLPERKLETIYFGGGTPSLLNQEELELIFDRISKIFTIKEEAEITLEANPDDLSPAKISELRRAGINRLSIGIQSFHDEHLSSMNRAHDAREAAYAVKLAQDSGISNISADLIYGIPAADHTILHDDLSKFARLDIPHISAYCLTIEAKTAFGKWVKQNKMQPIEDEFSAAQFEIVTATLAQNGYEQYEISNFARNGCYSVHNTAYWQRKPYLGLGPSAHSHNGPERQYNVANNTRYIKAIESAVIPAEKEILSPADRVNEYLLTGLRTKWGCDLMLLETLSEGRFEQTNRISLKKMMETGWLKKENNVLLLTSGGKLFADRISSDLFLLDE